ncbi:hypothetical protein [Aureicoccus marinus]|uniref:PsbP C-terminal domain-containing protein n=1 Tax=Aureicoccus marinus TaxID=754435 RepID=A0A2S7T865_9FLAO|nr:hypothetical protein [Aureicoccus marinus]PQJ15771.1 hypothetical protein BST99_08580 [Aureicoccus marinus]
MKHILTIFGLLFCAIVFGQTDSNIWSDTDTISTELYEFQVPTKWRNFGKMMGGGQGPEQFFEASGQGLPISYNGGPVKVSVFLVKMDQSKNLKSAKESVISGYFENPDRVFKKDKDYQEESFILSDKNEAILLNTRFYRKSKGLNQSRFDLATYSKKHKTAYMFTVSIQYVDDTYDFETENDLKDYAKKLYSTFMWN